MQGAGISIEGVGVIINNFAGADNWVRLLYQLRVSPYLFDKYSIPHTQCETAP